jgi:type II secretory pathway component GspD/PulD (secretin)
VPILGDIPFLGRFFSWDHKNHQDRELLVFLTPRIIEDKPMPLLKASSISREQNALAGLAARRESVGLALDNLSH